MSSQQSTAAHEQTPLVRDARMRLYKSIKAVEIISASICSHLTESDQHPPFVSTSNVALSHLSQPKVTCLLEFGSNTIVATTIMRIEDRLYRATETTGSCGKQRVGFQINSSP
jgi:hypothetical protein